MTNMLPPTTTTVRPSRIWALWRTVEIVAFWTFLITSYILLTKTSMAPKITINFYLFRAAGALVTMVASSVLLRRERRRRPYSISPTASLFISMANSIGLAILVVSVHDALSETDTARGSAIIIGALLGLGAPVALGRCAQATVIRSGRPLLGLPGDLIAIGGLSYWLRDDAVGQSDYLYTSLICTGVIGLCTMVAYVSILEHAQGSHR